MSIIYGLINGESLRAAIEGKYHAKLRDEVITPPYIFYQEFVDDTPDHVPTWPYWVAAHATMAWTITDGKARKLFDATGDYTDQDLLLLTMQAKEVPSIFYFA